MRRLSGLFFAAFLFVGCAQIKDSDVANRYLTRLPGDLKLREVGRQKYRFTCDYFNLDTTGNISSKERVTAEYTRHIEGDKARWNNVTVAQCDGSAQDFPPGQPLVFMEGLTYRPPGPTDALPHDFFSEFPPGAAHERNLVWDTHMIEAFGQGFFAKLSLNTPHHVAPAEVPLAGAGTLQNTDIQLTWTGISQKNQQMCALIHYQVFFNKLRISMPEMGLAGRSHSWGDIWVSLATKQIEYATLYEDVLGEFTTDTYPSARVVNTFRSGVLERSAQPQ